MQCSATCGCPGGQWRVAVGAPASVASPLGTPQTAVNVMHRSTPAQRSDRWTFRPLGVRARRGYGVYGGAADVSSPGATSCAGARVCTIILIYPFSHRIFSRFRNRSGPNFEHQSCSTSYQLQKCQRLYRVLPTRLSTNISTQQPKTRRL
jgi:hypothetical protein